MVQDHIDRGIIKPLRTTVFEASDAEKAFRFLASGKHIGKVFPYPLKIGFISTNYAHT
jgi:fatty acid synthase, animal type